MPQLFNIPIGGIKSGRHSFDFIIGKEFFEQFEESEIKEGALAVVVNADKSSSHIELDIKIQGTVEINCDRCLDIFSQPVNCRNRLFINFGKNRDDSDPDILTIPAEEHVLDLSQYFYEYIHLALPIRRVHPEDKEGNSTCNRDMLKKLDELLIEEERKTDPRWDGLKNVIDNN